MLNKINQNKADILKALAHPTRINILESLRKGERCVCEIIDIIELEQSNVSQHLAVMKKIGILTSRKEGLKVIYDVRHDEIFKILDMLDSFLTSQMNEMMIVLNNFKQKQTNIL